MGGYIGSQTSVALYDSYTKKESDTLHLISYRIITKRAMVEAGLTLVDGSFESGAVVYNTSEVVLQELTGKTYGWGGTIPVGGYIVPAGSTPSTAGGIGAGAWSDKTDLTLRSELNSWNWVAPAGSASFVYEDGALTQMTEQLPSGTRVTAYSYTEGQLTKAVETFGQLARTTTYTYLAGMLTGFTTTEGGA